MNSAPPDPLVALWQTAPEPDTLPLLRDLQRLQRMHRSLARSVIAIFFGVSVLLILAEAAGRIATHGLLPMLWILGIAIGARWRRRSRCRRIDALSLDTVSLLKFMLARAKGDLFIARCLYAGVPCGALLGGVVANLAGIGASPAAVALHPTLHPILTSAAVVLLILMVLTGAVLARSRRRQVFELGQKLKAVDAGL